MREYIINVFQRRFVPTPTEEEIEMVGRYLDTLSDEQEHKLYKSFRIIDGEDSF